MRTPTPDDPTPTCLCCNNASDVCTCTTRCDRIYHSQPPGKRGKPCRLRLAHYQVGERIRVAYTDMRVFPAHAGAEAPFEPWAPGVIKLDEKRWQAVQVEHREGTQLNIYGPWVRITDATLYPTMTAAIQRGLGRAWPPPCG